MNHTFRQMMLSRTMGALVWESELPIQRAFAQQGGAR